jgi:ribosomal protein S18 acetylase RimI-like enzyme
MQIRTYRPSDEGPVVDLWRRAGIDRPWLNLNAEIAEKRRRDRSLFLVAEADGQTVGCVMGAYDGRRGWIYHLATDPARARQGIGRALVAAVEQRMRRLGIAKVNLQVRGDNLGEVGFYDRLGYVDDNLTSMSKWLIPPEGSAS